MHIYPSHAFEASYDSNIPEIYAVVVACTFILVAIVFLIFNWFVNRRNEKLVVSAARSNAVLTAMFPTTIRDRIIEENNNNDGSGNGNDKKTRHNSLLKPSFKDALIGGGIGDMSRPPLADYFAEVSFVVAVAEIETVMAPNSLPFHFGCHRQLFCLQVSWTFVSFVGTTSDTSI